MDCTNLIKMPKAPCLQDGRYSTQREDMLNMCSQGHSQTSEQDKASFVI